jgi:hypothetical protein
MSLYHIGPSSNTTALSSRGKVMRVGRRLAKAKPKLTQN